MNVPFTTPALLLLARDKGDDDRSVVLCTPAHGRVAALAKHARGSRRRFGAALQPFCLFEAALRPSEGGFFFLNSVAALEFPLGPEPSLDVMLSGWMFLDLAETFSTPGTAQPVFFELILGGLRRLGLGAEGIAAVRVSVLWGSLELAGWAPHLDGCVACASPGPWPDFSLDAHRGGLLCPRCRSAGAPVFGGEVLTQWKALAAGAPPGDILPQTEAGLLRWLEYHTGRALRSVSLPQL